MLNGLFELNTLSRDEAKDLIYRLGGEVASSISKKTNYLIIGDNPGSKLAKAEKLNITILTEKAFSSMLP